MRFLKGHERMITFFWGVTPCSVADLHRKLGVMYVLHLQDRRMTWERKDAVCIY